MRTLSASDLLSLWERGYPLPPVGRAMLWLESACPENTQDELAALSIGARDERLLAIRENAFGGELQCIADCSACGEKQELALSVRALRGAHAHERNKDDFELQLDSHHVRFRLPDSADLAACRATGELNAARRVLLERCVVEAHRLSDGVACRASELPPAVVGALSERLSSADPLADLRLNWDCLGCGSHCQTPFDIVSFFWSELQNWSLRLLGDIHALASAYGWSEEAILALSATRRRLYLDMLGR